MYNVKHVTLDDIQLYFSKGATLHPLLYVEFLDYIFELERKRKVCPIPLTIFHHFSYTHRKSA